MTDRIKSRASECSYLYPRRTVMCGVFFSSALFATFVSEYFISITIVCVVFMIMRVLKTSGENLHFLAARQAAILVRPPLLCHLGTASFTVLVSFVMPQSLEQAQQEDISAPLDAKVHLIQTTRFMFVGYAVSWAMLGISSSFLAEHEWCAESLCVVAAGCVAHVVLSVQD